MWNTVTTLFRQYMGRGLIVGFFLVALVYLFLKEKDKVKRIVFLYTPVTILGLFFCPLFAGIILGIVGDEIYYRILWLLPITVVLAYAIVRVTIELKGKIRILWCVVCACLVAISGSYVYRNQYFHKADNMYHIPQTVVDICDQIAVEGREVVAVFPGEMIQFVRQYTALVCMPYGREVLVERWNFNNELLTVMESEEIEAEELAKWAKHYGCHYVILNENKILNGNMEEFDYELFTQVDGYRVYADATMYRGL